MTPTDEILLSKIKRLLEPERKKEVALLQRKLKRALQQRDEWKYQALKYRTTLLAQK